MGSRYFCGLYNGFHWQAGVSQCDVFTHGTVKQKALLLNDADFSSQPSGINHGEVCTIHQHSSGLRHVHALNQLCERAFAGTGATDNTNDLTWRYIQREFIQHEWAIWPIAKAYVFKCDPPLQVGQCAAIGVKARLFWGIQDIAEPLERNTGLLEILPKLHQLQDRTCYAPGDHIEGHQLADRHITIDDQMSSPPDN